MVSTSEILKNLADVARQVAPIVVPGAANAIAAAEALASAYNALKAHNGGQAPAEAEAASRALFEKVKAHADSTLGRLEGR